MSSVFSFFQRSVQGIHAFNELVGRCVSWLTLAMVVVTFTIVCLRYLFNVSWVGLQESIVYMHSLVFLLGAAYTLKHNGHVRVDIIYQHCTARVKAWIDFFGTLLLLLPVAGFIFWSSWEYVLNSWEILETSRNSGGLPIVYLLKSCLLLMSVLLALQGIAILLEKIIDLFQSEHQHG